MAEILLIHRFQKVTLPSNAEIIVDFNDVLLEQNDLRARQGMATIELTSGSSVQVSENSAIDQYSGVLTTANPKCIIDLYRGQPIRLKGGAGSETLNISILID